ncbi:hypothetical protein OAC11_04110 [Alphaproteobacteria bacterium]|nr:hypothetical protein [Alphaproteobacteria bacterium]
MKKTLLILFILTFSFSARSENFPELIERVNNVKIAFELSNDKQLGRIDGCKKTASNKNDKISYRKWVGASEFILKESEIYYITHYFMRDAINKDVKNAIHPINLKVKETQIYKTGYKNFLNSNECFQFGKRSIYSLMGMGISLLDMSTKQAWRVFDKIYPNASKKIIYAIKTDWPKTKLFDLK